MLVHAVHTVLIRNQHTPEHQSQVLRFSLLLIAPLAPGAIADKLLSKTALWPNMFRNDVRQAGALAMAKKKE